MQVLAFDTETPDYTPRILTIASEDKADLFDITPKNILDKFLDWLERYAEDNAVLFAHNLHYDMTVVLNQGLEFFLMPEFEVKYGGVHIRYFNDNPHFGEIIFGKKKRVQLRDTFAFFGRVKLKELGKSLGLPISKYDIDTELFSDAKSYKRRDFRAYALQDTKVTRLVGEKIMEFHKLDGIPLCVSGPQMAMMVFRKNYIPWPHSLTAVKKDIRHWEYSYHGGKNGCYIQTPVSLKNVYLFDINSAYPYAMTRIPSFLECEYKTDTINRIHSEYEGIYECRGISKCEYNSTFESDFKSVKNFSNDSIWITSYELKSLVDHGCLDKFKILQRHLVIPSTKYNPLREYALHYYKLKQETPKTDPMYIYYKVCMLNSLYGKFIERRYVIDKDYSIRGPNYNPAIATLITGHCRAQMHGMEHTSKALHSATDSVFTLDKNAFKTSKELGGVSLECSGQLKLLRTKLYLLYNSSRKLIKNARHGFHGTIETLENMIKNGVSEYEYTKIPTVGEHFLHKKLKLKMFGMNKMKSSLTVDLGNFAHSVVRLVDIGDIPNGKVNKRKQKVTKGRGTSSRTKSRH